MKTFKGKNNEVLGTFLENTDIVANPTLAGTEANLTGLQVGNTKYAVPQGGGSGIGFIEINIDNFDEGQHNVELSAQDFGKIMQREVFIKLINEDNETVFVYPSDFQTLYFTAPILEFSLSGSKLNIKGIDFEYNGNNYICSIADRLLTLTSTPQ